MSWDDYEEDPDSDEDYYVTCPECKSDVYEDSPSCPNCGHYITSSGQSGIANHWKIVAVVILILFALGFMAF